ncbi:MAG TPA: acyl-CoA dehydrogenase family protein [Candidatus Limnocylindrales bacterium]|nr:acyl-CoA dehydrogenase family protein [Candidatus Limnocylindrales bacterium]
MSLVLTDDQQMLKRAAADFVRKESPVARVRHYRDSDDAVGFSLELWRKMAELGWQAIIIPETYGGLGMGYVELACVLEECGRSLVPEPLLSTVLLGANAVLLGGSEAQRSDMLPRVADGSLLLTLAYQEHGARYDLHHCQTRAQASGGGYVLRGEKTLVLDAGAADKLLIVARSRGEVGDRSGLSLFIVDRDAPGLQVVRQKTMHLRPAAIVRLDGVEVSEAARIGEEGAAGPLLEEVIDRATAGLCAEMLGNMLATFEMTLEYLKTRKQFGVPIGSFQALKHRAAKMFIEIELARSAVLAAATAIDERSPQAKALISVAKARCSDAGVLIGYEGIQMHGGIGMTDEHDVGFYMKRLRGNEMTFGDASFHRDRFATLSGF